MAEQKTTKKTTKTVKKAKSKDAKKVESSVSSKKATPTKKISKSTSKLAVIRTGGKQYLVAEGDVLKVEKLPESEIKNKQVNFNEVLLFVDGDNVEIGKPLVGGKKVLAEVIEEGRNKKISVIHYKSKSRYFKRNGHRQPFLKVRISNIG